MDGPRDPTLSGSEQAFDAERPYALHPQVAIRPEPFGGLAYNYESRRLTLITARPLVDVVHALADHPTARAAVTAHVAAPDHGRYETALATLYDSGVIRAR
ncbi:MAG: mycofactocin biosynthesis chaperone MftB [Actinobacteria bacterium]|nr:mycofactocin biosynthesis chaperone MftB [Actinomycetota bacterium]